MAADLSNLDMRQVRAHYLRRKRAHLRLHELFNRGDVHGDAQLALGISDDTGNYSAAEHGMGPLILARATEQAVFDLATAIDVCPTTNHLPGLVYEHAIPGLKISIGTEVAAMLRPRRYWVGNVRTIWSHLLVKHGMHERRANEELALYHDGERESEMTYQVWQHVYLRMEPDILALGRLAAQAAAARGVRPGRPRYLWPDAVASSAFDAFALARADARPAFTRTVVRRQERGEGSPRSEASATPHAPRAIRRFYPGAAYENGTGAALESAGLPEIAARSHVE
jgi:hypothetical protein